MHLTNLRGDKAACSSSRSDIRRVGNVGLNIPWVSQIRSKAASQTTLALEAYKFILHVYASPTINFVPERSGGRPTLRIDMISLGSRNWNIAITSSLGSRKGQLGLTPELWRCWVRRFSICTRYMIDSTGARCRDRERRDESHRLLPASPPPLTTWSTLSLDSELMPLLASPYSSTCVRSFILLSVADRINHVFMQNYIPESSP